MCLVALKRRNIVVLCSAIAACIVSMPSVALAKLHTNQAPDGEFVLSLTDTAEGKRTHIDYQAAPWLHFGFEHNRELQSYQYNASAQIFEAKNSLPNVVLGVSDFLDSSDARSHYMVAGYELGPSEVNLGWANGASLDGWFASAAHHFVQERISVFAKANSYTKKYQQRYNTADWQIGATWQATPSFAFSVTHSAEQNIGLGVSLRLNTKKKLKTQLHPNVYALTNDKSGSEQKNKALVNSPVNKEFTSHTDAKRLELQSLLSHIAVNTSVAKITDKRIQLVVNQSRYSHWPDAVASIHAVLSAKYAAEFDDVEYVIEQNGHLLHRYLRPLTQSVNMASKDSKAKAAPFVNAGMSIPIRLQPVTTDTLSWVSQHGLAQRPQFSINVNNRLWLPQANDAMPENKMAYQLYASAEMDWALSQHWSVKASYQIDLSDNLSGDWSDIEVETESEGQTKLAQSAEGLLPVNSQLKARFAEHSHRLASALIQYTDTQVTQLYSDVAHIHYKAQAGYLDMIHAGVSGEVLYQPWLSRVAVGATFSHTQLREIDSPNKLSDNSSTSALVSGYWSLPIYNLDAALHAGRFLAEDAGARFELRRTFANGWQFGIWAAETQKRIDGKKRNFSDKGLFLRIPLGAVTGSRIKTRFTSQIGDLNRDNGAMLDPQNATLWWQQRDLRASAFQ